MVEETCKEYAKYLEEIDYKKEIAPIVVSIDEILTRMEEFESSLIIMKNLSSLTSLPEIIQCEEDFHRHFGKIDKLQVVLNSINQDLTALEHNVAKSEDELGFNNSGLKGFLKPWFGMSSASSSASKNERARADEGSSEHLSYEYNLGFKSCEYFGDTDTKNGMEESEA